MLLLMPALAFGQSQTLIFSEDFNSVTGTFLVNDWSEFAYGAYLSNPALPSGWGTSGGGGVYAFQFGSNKAILLNEGPGNDNSISRVIPGLTPGRTYTLNLKYWGDNILNATYGLRVMINGASTDYSRTITALGSGNSNTGTIVFVAAGTSTALLFTETTASGTASPIVDDIQLFEQQPSGPVFSENFNTVTGTSLGGGGSERASGSYLQNPTLPPGWTSAGGGGVYGFQIESTNNVAILLNEWPGNDNSISRTVPNLSSQRTYTLNFKHWGDNIAGGTYTFQVEIGGSITPHSFVISGGTLPTGAVATRSIPFTVTGTSVAITFRETTPSGQASVIIDDVEIVDSGPNGGSGGGTVTQTITASPTGILLTVDGSSCTSPCTRQWAPGSSHTVGAASSQQMGSPVYWFSYWSDNGAQSHSITAPSSPTTMTALYSTDAVQALRNCINSSQSATCTLQPGTHNVNGTIQILRSNVTVTGGGAQRADTKLVRDDFFVDPIMTVGNSTALTGVVLQNFTICGKNHLNGSGTSPVGCPRPAAPTACGLRTQTYTNPCVDISVEHVNATNPSNWSAGPYSNPFLNPTPYALTIANVDLEDAAGHALSLYSLNGVKRINDVYIHSSAFNYSGITGIAYGTNGATYLPLDCDNNPNFKNDPSAYAPRNLKITNNTFTGNNTGATGGNAVRWVTLGGAPGDGNNFTNNYTNPQGPQTAGGTIMFEACADTIRIVGNTFTAPARPDTDAMELYGRSIRVENNTISNYGREGIGLHNVYDAVVSNNNALTNNGYYVQTGGIMVTTGESPGIGDTSGRCVDPRDTNFVNITGNSSTNQRFGIHLYDHGPRGRNVISNLTIGSNILSPFTVAAIGKDQIVVTPGYSGWSLRPELSTSRHRALAPRALSARRCTQTPIPRQSFVFSAAHHLGDTQIQWLQGLFTTVGAFSQEPPPTIQGGCYFIFYRQAQVLYLAGPNGETWWDSSPISPSSGGRAISNGYCTIHAESAVSRVEAEHNNIMKLTLDIEFPASSTSSLIKHIYTVSGAAVESEYSRDADNKQWTYWGWWKTH